MDNKRYVGKLLQANNFYDIEGISDFTLSYIEKLIFDVVTYVNDNIRLGMIEQSHDITAEYELSQEMNDGHNRYFTYIIGDETTLTRFAEEYSHLEIKDYGFLTQEAVMDFLNLHNGLFAVMKSMEGTVELKLLPPKHNDGLYILEEQHSSIIEIPVIFSFGLIKFVICEKNS